MEAGERGAMRLVGLRRLSGCCGARVAHVGGLGDECGGLDLICVDCYQGVEEFLLENCLGEVVWPVDDAAIAAVNEMPRLKRSRRKPTEAEPPSYRLILPGRRG